MGIFAFLLGAFVATAAVPHDTSRLRSPDPVQPAMWKIQDGDTTIYLFGTFHALDGSTDWFKDRVRSAFMASDQLVLETLIPRRAPVPLSAPGKRLPPRAAPAATSSFKASTQMVMAASRKRGMSTALGADAELRQAAESSGKPVGALESFEYQLNLFSSLRPPTRSQVPVSPAGSDSIDMKALSIALAQLQDAWVRGDMATFAPMLDQMRLQSPEAYRMMFAERNARWATWIAARMRQPGTVFLAVGAGHLAGIDSVQNQLAAIGVGTTRVN